ncbi:MAG: putative Adenylate cyclase [Verrucomicrobiales bacterium]|nr:putative Adenylate cyclase [Verrucomicrobiales bacterium]
MPTISFPLKLLLAMMLVVGGVTAGTMYVTQQVVESAYRDQFNRQFENHAFFFSQLQEARLSAIQGKCAAIVKSVRLRSLIREYASDPSGDLATDCYMTTKDQLELGGIEGSRIKFRLLDRKGAILPPPQIFQPLSLGQNSKVLAKALTSSDQQQIAYLEDNENQKNPVQELIFSQIIDQDEVRGALVLAFDFPDFSRSDRRTQSKSGLMIDGHLHMAAVTLTPAASEQVAAVIRKESKRVLNPEPLEFVLNSIPYLAFYRILNPNSSFPPAYQITLFSRAAPLAQQRDLRRQILSSGVVALLGALLISFFLSHGLTAPIKDLVAGTVEIGKGNFTIHLPQRSGDEIGRLTQSFNSMAADLALKEKYRNVLDMVADKQVAEELLQGKITLGGEIREVSVLFCDIRGFTALTEKMDPPEVIQMLNEHFTPLTRIVYKHHGVVDKYVGDLIMAVFGAPKSFGPDALNAASCATEMIAERKNLNETSPHTIEVGIGVASGQALAGRMGSADRLNYTVLGERVNLASRLCSKAGRMEIVIDQTTAQKLGSVGVVEPTEELSLKGFAAPVQAFRLISITQNIKT